MPAFRHQAPAVDIDGPLNLTFHPMEPLIQNGNVSKVLILVIATIINAFLCLICLELSIQDFYESLVQTNQEGDLITHFAKCRVIEQGTAHSTLTVRHRIAKVAAIEIVLLWRVPMAQVTRMFSPLVFRLGTGLLQCRWHETLFQQVNVTLDLVDFFGLLRYRFRQIIHLKSFNIF